MWIKYHNIMRVRIFRWNLPFKFLRLGSRKNSLLSLVLDFVRLKKLPHDLARAEVAAGAPVSPLGPLLRIARPGVPAVLDLD